MDNTKLNELMKMYDEKINKIKGHLNPNAAYLSLFILSKQIEKTFHGSVLEIGILHGKYLALLANCLSEDEICVGVDPFYVKDTDERFVWNNIRKVAPIEKVQIIAERSDTRTAAAYRDTWGPFRFIHIDGSHRSPDVIHDLQLANDILNDFGIIAFDDFYNVLWPGVTEGFFRYFMDQENPELVPIGYCSNKLFLSRPSFAQLYLGMIQEFYLQFQGRLNLYAESIRTNTLLNREIAILT